jgi:hypothetical protein
VADLKIGILGEMNRNSANDWCVAISEKVLSSKATAARDRRVSRKTRRSKQSVVRWRALDRVRYWIVLIRPNLTDQSRRHPPT